MNHLFLLIIFWALQFIHQVVSTEFKVPVGPTPSKGKEHWSDTSPIGSRSLLYQGNATFLLVGSIAAPVNYINVGLRLNFGEIQKIAGELGTAWDRHRHVVMDADGASKQVWAKGQILERIRDFQLAKQRFDQLKEIAKGKPLGDREERSLGLIMAGAVGALAGLVGLGSTVYTEEQLHHLSKRDDDLERNVALLSDGMYQLQDIVADYISEQKQEEEVLRRIQSASHNVTMGTKVYTEATHIIQEVLRGEMPSEMASIEELKQILKEVKDVGKQQGLEPLVQKETDLMAVPFSWVMTTDYLRLILHVPAVMDRARMVRPLYVLDDAVLQQGQRLIRFSTTDQYISVSEDREVHVVHRTSDLNQCHRINRLYLCQSGSIMSKTVDSCTAALYFQDSDMAAAKCDLELVATQQKVVKTGRNRYRTNGRQRLNLICGHQGVQTSIETSGQQDTLIPDGCTASGTHYTLVGDPEDPWTKEMEHLLHLEEYQVTYGDNTQGVQRELRERFAHLRQTLGRLDLVQHSGKTRVDIFFYLAVGSCVLAVLGLGAMLGGAICLHRQQGAYHPRHKEEQHSAMGWLHGTLASLAPTGHRGDRVDNPGTNPGIDQEVGSNEVGRSLETLPRRRGRYEDEEEIVSA